MQAQNGDRVWVRYTGRLDSGEVFDSNEDAEAPLVFELGAQQVIEGFERAVTGLKVGEERRVRVPPEEAYGGWEEGLVARVARGALDDAALQVGLEVDVEDDEGNVAPARVVEMNDETVSLDFNHPLAGQALTFDVRLENVEKVSPNGSA